MFTHLHNRYPNLCNMTSVTCLSCAGDVRAGYMLAAAVALGHIYQAPPFRLSYKGLGEPLCFVAFGPLATNAFYFAQV